MGHLLKFLKVLVFCVPIFRTGVDREWWDPFIATSDICGQSVCNVYVVRLIILWIVF